MRTLTEQARAMRQQFQPLYSDLDAYMRKWTWPKHFGDARRIFESGGLAGSNAGQILSAVKPIKRFVKEVVTPVLRMLAAPQLCFDVVGVLERACDIVLDLRLASQGRGDSALLARKTFAFLNMYLSVIGVDEAVWTLKFHLSMHMSMQYVALQREVPGMALPNCFVLERASRSI